MSKPGHSKNGSIQAELAFALDRGIAFLSLFPVNARVRDADLRARVAMSAAASVPWTALAEMPRAEATDRIYGRASVSMLQSIAHQQAGQWDLSRSALRDALKDGFDTDLAIRILMCTGGFDGAGAGFANVEQARDSSVLPLQASLIPRLVPTLQATPGSSGAIRLIFVTSATELLTVDALHRQGAFDAAPLRPVILVYGRLISVPSRLRESLSGFASQHYPAVEVLDVMDWAAGVNRNNVAESALRLSEQHPGWRVEDVVLSRVHGELEQAILQAWPSAAITLFDNGIVSHEPVSLKNGKGASPRRFNPTDLHLYDIERVTRAYLSLVDLLGVPPHLPVDRVRPVEAWAMKDAFADAISFFERELPQPPDGPMDLVIGTSFNRATGVCIEEEADAYRSLVGELRAAGRSVLFKPHHREMAGLLGKDNDPGVIVIGPDAPAELLPLRYRIERAFSISSTALLTLQRLYGIRPYLIGEDVLPYGAFEHAHRLREFVECWSARQ